MARRIYDPLSHIPSAEAVEQALREAEAKAERLRILLRVAREIEAAGPADPRRGDRGKVVAHA
jgi:hypothetical protein